MASSYHRRGTGVAALLALAVCTGMPARAQDGLQELGNLLFTGNAANDRALPLGMVKVFDSSPCLIGLEEIGGGAYWIYLNNVFVDRIEFRPAQYNREHGTLLVLEGAPYVAENRLEGPHATQFNLYANSFEGLHRRIELPVYQVPPERLKVAFDRVYPSRCSGKRS